MFAEYPLLEFARLYDSVQLVTEYLPTRMVAVTTRSILFKVGLYTDAIYPKKKFLGKNLR